MSKQAEYTKQSALQQILEGINEFVPMLCIEHKKTGCVITQNYTIKNNGGDRFGIFLEKVLLEEKDYLINKVIIMSSAPRTIEIMSMSRLSFPDSVGLLVVSHFTTEEKICQGA